MPLKWWLLFMPYANNNSAKKAKKAEQADDADAT